MQNTMPVITVLTNERELIHGGIEMLRRLPDAELMPAETVERLLAP